MTTILRQDTLTATDLFNLPWVLIQEQVWRPYVGYDYSKTVGKSYLKTHFPQGLASIIKGILDSNYLIGFSSDWHSGRTVTIIAQGSQVPHIFVKAETLEAAISQAFQQYVTYNGGAVQDLTSSTFGQKLQTCNLDNLLNWHFAKVTLGLMESDYYLRIRYRDKEEEKKRTVFFKDVEE
ncbi:MAG: hypothetical protein ACE5GN_06710 [Waddliaceae bacterium]